jgi:hypothetical protein
MTLALARVLALAQAFGHLLYFLDLHLLFTLRLVFLLDYVPVILSRCHNTSIGEILYFVFQKTVFVAVGLKPVFRRI